MPSYSTARLRLSLEDQQDQYVAVSKDLWQTIVPVDYLKEFIPLSITVPSLVTPNPVSNGTKPVLKSFIVYCKLTEQGDEEGYTVHASSYLIQTLYGKDALNQLEEEEGEALCLAQIKPVELIELDELILGALNQQSYEFAQRDTAALIQLFVKEPSTIIRNSGKYNFGNGLLYEALMTNPVQQGCIFSSDCTQVLTVDLSDSGNTDPEELKVDTNNAAFNMLHSPAIPNVIEPKELGVKILQQRWPEARLHPSPNSIDDDESRVYVGIKDLAQCGVFSGDWVLVSGNNPKKSRLCRVYGIDDIPENQGMVHLPPALYFNLDLPLPPASVEDTRITVTRVDSPSLEGPPIATSVTVARIASPASMDKALQLAFLESLKAWFEAKERIVCKDDVIAICLNEDSVRLKPLEEESNGQVLPGKPTTLACFKVTKLDYASDTSKIHPSYFGSGRRIVPSKTQMVQTGVEYSRVPVGSISHYYGFSEKLPLIRSQSTAYKELHELIASSLHPLGRDFELSCNALFHGPRGGGKATLVKEVVEELGVHLYEFSIYDIVSDTDAKTEVHLRAKFDKAAALAPCVVLIRHMEGLAKKSAVVESGQEPLLATVLQECIKNVNAAHIATGYPVMVIATTGDIDTLPSSVLSCFRHEISMCAPDEKARLQIIDNLLLNSPLAPDVSLSNLATQTAALVAKDLVDLVGRAGVLALQRIDKSIHSKSKESGRLLAPCSITTQDIQAAGIALTAADFESALGEARSSYSDSIGAPKIPTVTWDDVGGMAHVKDDILDTIQLPLEHPELFGAGLKKRSGILLYGPPGTGKTLLAKAIATSCSLNFFSVKGPELLNMYIGESEANVRRVFQRARDAKPCVIFFDELDSVAPKRGEKGDSGGVMDRIVSQLLAELDGMGEGGEDSSAGDVFVIGATNRPDLLDPALLRPGRFDKLLYLGVSQDHESQLRIIEALTRKFRLHPDLDLRKVAECCPFHYTGADFYALCSDAMLKAMTRVANTIEEKVKQLNQEKREDLPQPLTVQYYLSHMVTPDEIVVQAEEVDFMKALEELIPSVSATELEHYSKVREKFERASEDEEKEENKVKDEEIERALLESKKEEEERQKAATKNRKGKGKQRAH
ncbi:P-loop containing nucleoside triphosphate hydrolase protein [Gilbertella persicaria]|uniref:Peroxisomal ATPase PEX6 n=1 Tax=Rhizopus stolonifer TaxID=4846 RepID=A0A367KXY0_RHIST|nr:P-loop containing nucleoside triphosphate hydrolase protein [Gilbertella persicaria]KAI8061520.1 P-loop containing nucleoside triphosphate hydrolase protein [Gilbertella persicaria]RCI07073.1 peroxisomal assembly protein [Rhizopus stolonifer]